MEASGVVGAMCWTGPDATGSRGPGGAGRCWVPAWWSCGGRVVADGGRSLPWLPFSQGNRKQEGREREDEKKRRRFQVYHHKLGLGERAWGPRGVRLRPELGSPRSHSLSSTGSKGSDRGPVLQLGSCGLRSRRRDAGAQGRAGSVRAGTRGRARPSFPRGSRRVRSHVLSVLLGPLPLDTPSGSRGVAEDLPPPEECCFGGGRGQEGPREPVRLPHEAGLCGQSRR